MLPMIFRRGDCFGVIEPHGRKNEGRKNRGKASLSEYIRYTIRVRISIPQQANLLTAALPDLKRGLQDETFSQSNQTL
jgi:hypothetical protein